MDESEFTAAERNVIQYMKRGFSNKAIASALEITTSTVKYHATNIYRKSNAKSRADFIVKILHPVTHESET